MIAMDETLKGYVSDDLVDHHDALDKAVDKDSFREFLKAKGVQLPGEVDDVPPVPVAAAKGPPAAPARKT
jgi:hypothetical protein